MACGEGVTVTQRGLRAVGLAFVIFTYFQQIIAVYESEPDNFARLSELMQEMQETGQPPSEIVKDLAPGKARFDHFHNLLWLIVNELRSSVRR